MAMGEPERLAVAHAADEGDLVLLELHARAPPEAEAAPGQLVGDVLDGELEPGGHALDDHDEGTARGTRRRSGSATSGQSTGRPRRRPNPLRPTRSALGSVRADAAGR